jgi:hypothetical protein
MPSHTPPLIATALLVLVCAACASRDTELDPRLRQLTVGISRDSALRIIGAGAPGADSLRNVYRREEYIINGMPLEIFFYSRDGLKEGQGVAPPESTLRPVVLNMGRVTGWGWTYFDSVARANNFRVHVR